MTKIIGLREDIQMSLALKQYIHQWLLTTRQQHKQKTQPPLLEAKKSPK